jgi:hypothetical protein
MVRQLIKLVDRAEERLQQWQVRLRDGLAPKLSVSIPVEPSRPARPQGPSLQNPYPFPEDELLRHRVSRRSTRRGEPQRAGEKKARRRISAAEFDLRFAR